MKTLIAIALSILTVTSNASTETRTQTGPWLKSRKYDYRYVTTYQVKRVKRALPEFPWIEEDCHDEGQRFANWSKSISYEISYGGGFNFSLLGFLEIDLGGDRSKSVEFSFQRWVVPTKGLRARHVLHEVYEVWEGSTQVEYKYSDEDRRLASKSFPFKLSKVNYGLSVDRTVLEVCQ